MGSCRHWPKQSCLYWCGSQPSEKYWTRVVMRTCFMVIWYDKRIMYCNACSSLSKKKTTWHQLKWNANTYQSIQIIYNKPTEVTEGQILAVYLCLFRLVLARLWLCNVCLYCDFCEPEILMIPFLFKLFDLICHVFLVGDTQTCIRPGPPRGFSTVVETIWYINHVRCACILCFSHTY